MSGKTTAARYYSRAFCAHRIPVVVFDPVGTDTKGGGWGDGATVYSDVNKFEEYLYGGKLKPCKLFIDEASAIFGHDQKHNFWLAERGRHCGLQLFMITQRPMRVHPSVRTQFGEAFIFRLTNSDMVNIGADYGHNLRGISLDKGDYLHLISGRAKYTRGNIFNQAKKAT